MSGIRSITRNTVVRGPAHPASAPIYVDSDDNAVKIIPAGTGTTELAFNLAATASGFRTAVGTGTLVTGSVVVTTGLTSVLGFVASVYGATGFATGATEVNKIIVGSITTGAVTVTGAFNSFVTGAATLSASGTATFYWLAFGT